MPRILIVGAPRTGKTTASEFVARSLGIHLVHTDQYKDLAWDLQKVAVYDHMMVLNNTNFVMEGTTVSRALNYWSTNNPDVKPCEVVLYLTKYMVPRSDLAPGQLGMGTRVRNTMEKLTPWLEGLGVRVEKF